MEPVVVATGGAVTNQIFAETVVSPTVMLQLSVVNLLPYLALYALSMRAVLSLDTVVRR